MIWAELVAGLVLLLGGGEALVRGSVVAAMRLGVSKLLIGLTLVGFGTSMPELVASLKGALAGSPGVAVGNVVGSSIANILLILGISAVLLPIATPRQAFQRDGAVLIGVTILMTGAVLVGVLSRPFGIVFLALLAAYTTWTYLTERRRTAPRAAVIHNAEAEEPGADQMKMRTALLLAVAGILGVVFGANFLVNAAIEIAVGRGMSETVIGLTLVAIGTSLPELATSVIAAIRRHGEVALGNVIGSNIFNILGIAGTTAIVVPVSVPAQIVEFDIWVMLAATMLLGVLTVSGGRVSRAEGALLLAGYAAYLWFQLAEAPRNLLGLS